VVGREGGRPERVADDPWSVACEAGPAIFGDLALVDDADELFVRGFVQLMRGRREQAAASFVAAKQHGSTRADRWLAHLGVAAPARAAAARPELAAATKVANALERRDTKRILAALGGLAAATGTIGAEALAAALNWVLGDPRATDIAPLAPLVTRAAALCAGVHADETATYNLACLAARLGDKAGMLAWLRASLSAGTEPHEPPRDADFRRYWKDPDFRALCPAKLIPWREVRIWKISTGREVSDDNSKAAVLRGFRDTGALRGHSLLDPSLWDLDDAASVERHAPVADHIDWSGLP
jgi:hypothetical protein